MTHFHFPARDAKIPARDAVTIRSDVVRCICKPFTKGRFDTAEVVCGALRLYEVSSDADPRRAAKRILLHRPNSHKNPLLVEGQSTMSAKAEAVQIQYPLRERRKRRTRAALIEAAVDLFSTKGYDDTTLEEVADQAGLHVQTLYRHFPSKPELAVAVDRTHVEDFRVAIEDPDRSDTTFEFWRKRIILATSGLETQTGGYRNFRALVQQQNRSPSIALRLHTLLFTS
ncbi:MAG: helix-turn-helix transcriptional regulator, partial [Gammaproteobacteria bacterium]|nr:helix-turn-helix transcriptional regulator [Gammaproteobacteria bacterium]